MTGLIFINLLELHAFSFGPISAVESEQDDLESAANKHWVERCGSCENQIEAQAAGIPSRVIDYWNSNPGQSPLTYRGPDQDGFVTTASHLADDLAAGINQIRFGTSIDAPDTVFTITDDLTIYGDGHSLTAEKLEIDGSAVEVKINQLILNNLTLTTMGSSQVTLEDGQTTDLEVDWTSWVSLINNPVINSRFYESSVVEGAENIQQALINSPGVELDRFNRNRIDPGSSYSPVITVELFELEIEISPHENAGTIELNGQRLDPLPYLLDLAEGETLAVVASSLNDYQFDRWELNGNNLSSDPELSFTMPGADTQLTAHFVFSLPPMGPPDGLEGDGLSDMDGNQYQTVWLNGLEWMAENLRTRWYSDGDMIATDFMTDTDWREATEGGYALYPHEEIDGLDSPRQVAEAYGRLYNWKAVDDPRGLCPVGWKVPTETDWINLVDHMADEHNEITQQNIGSYLRSCRQINSPLGGQCNTDIHPRWNHQFDGFHGNDQFGFSALPGGMRHQYGGFNDIGTWGRWWSSTTENTNPENAHIFGLSNFHPESGPEIDQYYIKTFGLSVRCVRDIYPGQNEVTLTIKTSGIGNITPSVGTHVFPQGETINLAAEQSDPSWLFIEWEGAVDDNSSAETTITLHEDRVVKAIFAAL